MRPEPGFRPQHGHAQQPSRVEPIPKMETLDACEVAPVSSSAAPGEEERRERAASIAGAGRPSGTARRTAAGADARQAARDQRAGGARPTPRATFARE